MAVADPFGVHLTLFPIGEESTISDHAKNDNFDATTNTADVMNPSCSSPPII